jgi:hypothetical protein
VLNLSPAPLKFCSNTKNNSWNKIQTQDLQGLTTIIMYEGVNHYTMKDIKLEHPDMIILAFYWHHVSLLLVLYLLSFLYFASVAKPLSIDDLKIDLFQ